MSPTVVRDEPVRVPQGTLREFAEAAFVALGVAREDAVNAADTLIEADRRGFTSHGMARFERFYVQPLEQGLIKPDAEWIVRAESPSTAAIDADGALGLSVGARAMDLAIHKAREAGSGWVTVANSHHFGAAGVHATRALRDDMLGIVVTNTGPLVLPAGGAELRLGTNPIAFAAPTADDRPFIFDAATSVTSAGKFEAYDRQGLQAPPGWALTEELEPARNPAGVLHKLLLLPLGSDAEHSWHKGYGLAMVVDILSGLLSAMGPGYALGSNWTQEGFPSAHFFGALRIDAFMDADAFKASMSSYMAELRSTPPLPDVGAVLAPGDVEAQTITDRDAHGIPLYPASIASLRNVAQRLNLPLDLEAQGAS